MTGQIIYRQPKPCACHPDGGLLANVLRTGDVWQCDECDKTWVYKDKSNSGYWWKPESNRQKRKRLGPAATTGMMGV